MKCRMIAHVVRASEMQHVITDIYSKKMNKSESLQNLCWIDYLWDRIQEVVGVQLEFFERRSTEGILITRGNFCYFVALYSLPFCALLFPLCPEWMGWSWIYRGELSLLMSWRGVLSLLWVFSYFVGEESSFESPLSHVVLCRIGISAFESCQGGICLSLNHFWVLSSFV